MLYGVTLGQSRVSWVILTCCASGLMRIFRKNRLNEPFVCVFVVLPLPD